MRRLIVLIKKDLKLLILLEDRRTRLTFSDVQINQNLPAELFSEEALALAKDQR